MPPKDLPQPSSKESQAAPPPTITIEELKSKARRVNFSEHAKSHLSWEPDPSREQPPVIIGKDTLEKDFLIGYAVDLNKMPDGSIVIVRGASGHRSANYVIRKEDDKRVKVWGPRNLPMTGWLNSISTWNLDSLDQKSDQIDWYPGTLIRNGFMGIRHAAIFMPYFDTDKEGNLEKPKNSWMDTAGQIYIKKLIKTPSTAAAFRS